MILSVQKVDREAFFAYKRTDITTFKLRCTSENKFFHKMDTKDQPLDVCEEGSGDEDEYDLEEDKTPAKFDFLSGGKTV